MLRLSMRTKTIIFLLIAIFGLVGCTDEVVYDDPNDLGTLFAPVWESWELLQNYYVEQPIDSVALFDGAVEGLLAEYGEDQASALSDDFVMEVTELVQIAIAAGTPTEQIADSIEFWNYWYQIEQVETDPERLEALMRSSLRSMVAALGDPYTAYLDPFEFADLNSPLEGEYEGIGAWVDTGGDYLTIISPMDDSPAEEAGLQVNDQVIAIDGEDMTGVDPELARRKVLGPADSVVVLTILREGMDPFDVEVTRGLIVMVSVTGEMLDDGIGYIELNTFADDTEAELIAVLEELLAQNPKGLILDLRNNGGGYLDTSVEVTSQFIGEGVVLYQEYGDGSREVHEILDGGIALDIPMVLLVNQATASASEIVTGAFKAYDRAPVVGMLTFGKGSVQLPITLDNNQGGIRITLARWLTPDEQLIHGIGIEPDYVVDYTEEDAANGMSIRS